MTACANETDEHMRIGVMMMATFARCHPASIDLSSKPKDATDNVDIAPRLGFP
jgi:hypothetical protein